MHGYGFTAGLFAPLSFGGTAILARPRLAASLAKLLITYEPEIVVGGPCAVRRVVRAAPAVRRTRATAVVVRGSAAAHRGASQVRGRVGRGDRRAVRDDGVRRGDRRS